VVVCGIVVSPESLAISLNLIEGSEDGEGFDADAEEFEGFVRGGFCEREGCVSATRIDVASARKLQAFMD
jgi:hypothetical protein